MKFIKSYLLVFPVIFAGLLGTFTVVIIRGQSPKTPTQSAKTSGAAPTDTLVKPTADMRPRQVVPVNENASNASAFASAASENARLSSELTWLFGGKEQRGWYLYDLLIRRLIGTDRASASPAFADALSKWQSKSGLLPTGILDEDSLYAMVKTWQDARIQDRTIATPDQLLVAPVSDFYDPTRPDELRQVERQAYAAYKRMIAAAIADKSLKLTVGDDGQLAPEEKFLKIVSSFRSREYQDQLRRQSPNAGRAGLAINSPHFTGKALDLYVGGEPVDTRDSNRAIQVNTPVYQWLVRNAERFGFRPYYYEPWHWEYVAAK
jgi:zinc D-Ala-D-Ala carboxypeptidase